MVFISISVKFYIWNLCFNFYQKKSFVQDVLQWKQGTFRIVICMPMIFFKEFMVLIGCLPGPIYRESDKLSEKLL